MKGKRTMSMILIFLLSISLIACGNGRDSDAAQSDQSQDKEQVDKDEESDKTEKDDKEPEGDGKLFDEPHIRLLFFLFRQLYFLDEFIQP